MEGTLLKWTNYYNGWQPRYFVLNENGILSYYKSHELIHEGCKGSCLVLACEVKAHPNDSLRFDLIIPGEQFFCLKAKTQQERQHWLVALGSCKSRGTKSTTTTTTITSNNNNNTSTLISHLSAIDHDLKLKVQELRLYETVLMQRIHSIKSIVNDTPTPNVKDLDETSSMLSMTCDAFIQTLDECVKLATNDSTNSLSQRKLSDEFNSTKSLNAISILPKQMIYRTFFSELHLKFSALSSLSFNEIPSELFLSTCEQYCNLIGTCRSDANKCINTLRKKMSNDSNQFPTLFSIINNEIITQITKEKDSATNALLWLKRNMHFLACFIHEFGQGDKTVEDAMNKAYRQILKSFHNWTTRGIYSLAIQSVPNNEDFFISLTIDRNDAQDILFERQVLNEMLEHSTHMFIVLNKINDFYIHYKLESDEIID
ncbi:unnamed protein product [Adineta steineri]|uniref:Pleckstrin homology domain-containing family A member 8 n=1 Tax=Adineta steineri TaxID=433720 RepID=A0A814DHA7_9BILA|nr:unnamed protein product [Adineta steineri]